MKFLKPVALFGFGIVVAFIATSCSPKKHDDCGFVQNVYGQRISWKSKKPIKVYLDASVPVALHDSVRHAAETWEKQIGRKVFDISEDSSQLGNSPRDQKNGVYFLSEWESDKSSEQGRTTVSWAGDVIQEADIRINAADFSYYDIKNRKVLIGSARMKAAGQVPAEGYSFQALMVHELGHFLGLRHREGATVMVTNLGPYDNRIELSASDQEAVSCEYK